MTFAIWNDIYIYRTVGMEHPYRTVGMEQRALMREGTRVQCEF